MCLRKNGSWIKFTFVIAACVVAVYIYAFNFNGISHYLLARRYSHQLFHSLASSSIGEQQQEALRNTLPIIDEIIAESLCRNIDNCTFNYRFLPPFNRQPFTPQGLKTAAQLRESTVLVVVYNWPKQSVTAPLIYAMVGHFFADLRFCATAPNGSIFASEMSNIWPANVTEPFEHVYLNYQRDRKPIKDNAGETMYYCVNMALNAVEETRPDLEVTGILLMHDDVLLNIWNIFNGDYELDLGKSHLMPWFNMYDIDSLANCGDDEQLYFSYSGIIDPVYCGNARNPWVFFPRLYKTNVKAFYQEMALLASNASNSPIFADCWNRLVSVTKQPNRALGGLADFFYLAKRDFASVLALFELADKHQVWQEIAVPVIFNACVEPNYIGRIDPTGWSRHYRKSVDTPWLRKDIDEVYDAKKYMFAHPFKLSGPAKAMSHLNGTTADNLTCMYCLLKLHTDYLQQTLSIITRT